MNEAETSASLVSVLLPGGAPGPFDYAGGGFDLVRGSVVAVPLGRRTVLGVVWGPGEGGVDPGKVKPVAGVYPARPLPPALCDFVDWVADYTLSSRGGVLSLALRSTEALEEPPTRTLYRLNPDARPRSTPQRARALAAAADGLAREPGEWAEIAGVSTAVIKALIGAGAFAPVIAPRDPAIDPPRPDFAEADLSPLQLAAAGELKRAVGQGFSATLLDGVTGSGKTEVYFEAIAEALRRGEPSLVLLPEIALTHQFMDRFEARFGARPCEWHSDVKPRERARVWRGVADGSARVVVGARSALFLPFPRLGLIVCDEEHDQAFKQEEGLVYNARDMAVVRARIEACPIVLSSATPSLETWANARAGRYGHVALPGRYGPARLPDVEVVDLRADRPARDRFLAPGLEAAIEANMAQGGQSLLFLNRRGYAPLNICRACGGRIECPNCTAWLVEHRYRGRLVCHHCGFEKRKPPACEGCGEPDAIVASGPGVERIAEEAKALWPEARIAIASSDMLHGPRATQEAVRRMEAGEVDLLIGTQIVAKGHNFPNLTLVGVVDADLGLKGGDPRARERCFQLLHQVAGRAGRAGRPGRVMLQTHAPDDRLIRAIASGDRDGFLEAEAADRERIGFPPFGRLAALIVSAEDEREAEAYAKALREAAPRVEGAVVWGPAPALIAKLRGRTRLRFLLTAPRNFRVQGYLREWLAAAPPSGRVRLSVDVDPMSFF